MTTLGILASWAAALFGAWAFVVGLVAAPSDVGGTATGIGAGDDPRARPVVPAHARSARRALLAAALFALVAAVALLQLLLAGDFTVNYVARTVASNVPSGRRPAALFQLAAGAVLPTAALVALAGVLATRRARSTLGAAVAGSVVMALVAASLAAQPFAILAWVPTDGLGLAPALHQPLSIVGHAALSIAIAAATASAAGAADGLADGGASAVVRPDAAVAGASAPVGHSLAPLATLAAIAVAMWGQARGAFVAGITSTPAPSAAWSGALVAALAGAACSWRAQRVGAAPLLAASLGTLGLLVAALLATPGRAATPLALSAFGAIALVAAAVGGLGTVRGEPAGGQTPGGQPAGAELAGDGRPRVAGLLATAAVLLAIGGGAAALWLRAADSEWLGLGAQVALAAALVAAAFAAAGGDRAWRAGRSAVIVTAAAGVGVAWWLSAAPVGLLWGGAAGATLGAATVVAWGTGAQAGRWPTALLLGAAACASLAALGEGAARTIAQPLRVGTQAEVAVGRGANISLAHQGVSRYQDGNAHVVAVALDAARGARSLALVTAERREYIDGRDESLGPQTAPPAVLALTLHEVRITLDSLAADETVTLRLSVVPLSRGWGAAIVLVLAAIALGVIAPRPTASRPPAPHHRA